MQPKLLWFLIKHLLHTFKVLFSNFIRILVCGPEVFAFSPYQLWNRLSSFWDMEHNVPHKIWKWIFEIFWKKIRVLLRIRFCRDKCMLIGAKLFIEVVLKNCVNSIMSLLQHNVASWFLVKNAMKGVILQSNDFSVFF